MYLADSDLITLCEHNQLVRPFNADFVGPCSIDLTLSDRILVEPWSPDRLNWDWNERFISDETPYNLQPGEMILACTHEVVFMPVNKTGLLVLRSSAARMGIDHHFSGVVDPGFAGQLTLELKNNLRRHAIPITPRMRLVQLMVSEMAGKVLRDYDHVGWYQGQHGPTPSNYRVRAKHRARRMFGSDSFRKGSVT